jgi:hypothetical protein
VADVSKWRIHKDWRFDGKWVVHAPGNSLLAAFVGNNFRHCVNALPYLMRIDANWKRLNGGRVRRGA